jgi:hypothetical protein
MFPRQKTRFPGRRNAICEKQNLRKDHAFTEMVLRVAVGAQRQASWVAPRPHQRAFAEKNNK